MKTTTAKKNIRTALAAVPMNWRNNVTNITGTMMDDGRCFVAVQFTVGHRTKFAAEFQVALLAALSVLDPLASFSHSNRIALFI